MSATITLRRNFSHLHIPYPGTRAQESFRNSFGFKCYDDDVPESLICLHTYSYLFCIKIWNPKRKIFRSVFFALFRSADRREKTNSFVLFLHWFSTPVPLSHFLLVQFSCKRTHFLVFPESFWLTLQWTADFSLDGNKNNNDLYTEPIEPCEDEEMNKYRIRSVRARQQMYFINIWMFFLCSKCDVDWSIGQDDLCSLDFFRGAVHLPKSKMFARKNLVFQRPE